VVSDQLLSLAKGTAHRLKLVIRTLLIGAMDFGLPQIQRYIDVMKYPTIPPASMITSSFELTDPPGAHVGNCHVCNQPVDAECARWGRVLQRQHLTCENLCANCNTFGPPENMTLGSRAEYEGPRLFCSFCSYLARGNKTTFQRITKLQQYVFILRVSHARFEESLSSSNALGMLSERERPSSPKTTMIEDRDDEARKVAVAKLYRRETENDKEVVLQDVSTQKFEYGLGTEGDDVRITLRVTGVPDQAKNAAMERVYGMLAHNDEPRIYEM
jgi:hypothetical protein